MRKKLNNRLIVTLCTAGTCLAATGCAVTSSSRAPSEVARIEHSTLQQAGANPAKVAMSPQLVSSENDGYKVSAGYGSLKGRQLISASHKTAAIARASGSEKTDSVSQIAKVSFDSAEESRLGSFEPELSLQGGTHGMVQDQGKVKGNAQGRVQLLGAGQPKLDVAPKSTPKLISPQHQDAVAPGPVVTGAGEGLTLSEAVSLARSANPAVSQIHASIEALQGKLVQAGLRPNPTVGINGDDINEDGGAGRYGVYYSQRIVRGGKLDRAQQVVCAEIQVAQQRLAAVEAKLETDTKKLFFDLLIAQQKKRLADQLVGISRNAAEVSKKLFEAKESAKTVLLQSEIELQEALILQKQTENMKIAATKRLEAFLGQSLGGREILGNVKAGWEVGSQQETLGRVIDQNPEIQALIEDIRRANQVVCRQKVEPIGDVTWQTSLQYDTVSDDLIAGFQVGLPIPRNNQNQGAIMQAKQLAVAAGQRLEKRKLKLEVDVANVYRDYANAEIQIKAYQKRILPLAKETLDLINEGYRQGEANFLQLLTAQRTYFQTNLAYYDQLNNLWQKKIEIDGMLLSGSLDD